MSSRQGCSSTSLRSFVRVPASPLFRSWLPFLGFVVSRSRSERARTQPPENERGKLIRDQTLCRSYTIVLAMLVSDDKTPKGPVDESPAVEVRA